MNVKHRTISLGRLIDRTKIADIAPAQVSSSFDVARSIRIDVRFNFWKKVFNHFQGNSRVNI
jgi:hypothetical protein